jgi:predicted RNA-binding Zn ribbon-like protein
VKTSPPGPVGGEPLAIELHNTVYAFRGELVDTLETPDGLSAWLDAVADRLPAPARAADVGRRPEFVALRAAVGELLEAALAGKRPPAGALEMVNAAAGRAPVSAGAVPDAEGRLEGQTRYHTTDPTDIALAAFAADAIDLLTGPGGNDVRACRAPGCVLMFLKDHPRRRWCSAACGNRARQARHYARAREARD